MTLYAGDDSKKENEYHQLEALTYAVDFETGDMVVGGRVTLMNSTSLVYLYYMDGSNCELSWHHFLSEEDSAHNREIVALEIRSNPSRIFGLIQSDAG